ncbi:MAG: site-specific DNA-methyltransferase [Candidatus Margulisbacteria bacterium]|nr:site-specific DNA-methyltransferase [Candidatus Margulisiibacteriota bacterium]
MAALKSLLPFYAGQVKCVYIDPPYNTGSAFEHYDDNLEHAKWLALIYPRMELLRELLAEDGSIWISIDDDESHYLKIICDEIFGRNNFVNNVIWEKKFSPQNDAKWLSDNHDHILVYAKTKEIWRPNLLPRTEEMAARYTNWDNDPRGVWSSSDLTAQDPFEYGQYEITTPGGKTYLPGNNRHWIYAKEKFMQLQKDNRIWFGESGNNKPRLKKFLYEIQSGMVPLTLWKHTEVGHNQEAKKEINTLFGVTSAFDTPKPERLIQRILQLATKENDLVLDSFLGSGTTAAVAHKMGRKYIGIEIGEQAKTHCIPRLKKVIDGEQGGISRSVGWQGGGGFRFFTLGAPVFDENGRIHTDIIFDQLAARLSQNPDRRR